MACGCEEISCVDVYVNPCNVGTSININASSTGNYRALLEFNGTYKNFGVAVTSGEDITFPTISLNENYAHLLKLYDTNDSFLGCYTLRTYLALNVPDSPVIPPSGDTWQWAQLSVNGNTLDSELLTGDISPIIWINEQPVDWMVQGITQTATGLDFTAIGGAFGSVIFQYKNIPV